MIGAKPLKQNDGHGVDDPAFVQPFERVRGRKGEDADIFVFIGYTEDTFGAAGIDTPTKPKDGLGSAARAD